jgi:hypothetical protein
MGTRRTGSEGRSGGARRRPSDSHVLLPPLGREVPSYEYVITGILYRRLVGEADTRCRGEVRGVVGQTFEAVVSCVDFAD